MKPYLTYEESNTEWIGQVPADWIVSKYKHHVSVQNGFAFKSSFFDKENGFPILRIRDITTGDISTYFTGEYDPDYIVSKDDLLVGMDGDFNIRWWDKDDILLNQRCCRIIEDYTVDRRFLYYTLPFNLKVINDLTYYTTVKHLSSSDIEDASFPLPSLPEQKQIARFLDHQTGIIDALIEKKEALIEKLKEQRQAIINEAVTKGLNPNAPLKDSGIPWLGDIPEHWEVVKLKYLTNAVETGKTPSTARDDFYENGTIDWFSPGDFTSLKLHHSNKKITEVAVSENGLKLYPKNSILLIGIGATLGKVAITNDVSFSNQQINAIVFNSSVNPLFGLYYLDSIKDQIRNESNASTMAILNQSKTKDLLVVRPPKEEQEQIADFIESNEIKLGKLKESIETQIQKLREYRQSIISEAVTGKIDVREWEPKN